MYKERLPTKNNQELSGHRSRESRGDPKHKFGRKIKWQNGKDHPPFIPHTRYRQSPELDALDFPVVSFLADEQFFPFS